MVGAGRLQAREGELPLTKVNLQFMAERHLMGIIVSRGAPFQQKHAAISLDERLGSVRRTGGEGTDRKNVPEVISQQHGLDFRGNQMNGLEIHRTLPQNQKASYGLPCAKALHTRLSFPARNGAVRRATPHLAAVSGPTERPDASKALKTGLWATIFTIAPACE